jgi:hypothetical protein
MKFLEEFRVSKTISLFESGYRYCRYLRKVWLDASGKAFVFSCYYGKLSVFGTDGDDGFLGFGNRMPLFEKLDCCVRIWEDLSCLRLDGPSFGEVPDIGRTSEEVLLFVRGKAEVFEGQAKLLDFRVVSEELGMFSALVDVCGVVDSIVLLAGKVNQLSSFWDFLSAKDFASDVFGEIFLFDWSESIDRVGRDVCVEQISLSSG